MRTRSISTPCGSAHANCGASRATHAIRLRLTYTNLIFSMAEHAPPAEPERVFSEPWHAHVFAFAVKLSQAGHFTWSEWGEHFGTHLRRAAAADDSAADPRPMPEVDSATYYDVWLDTLESLLIQRGLASAAD